MSNIRGNQRDAQMDGEFLVALHRDLLKIRVAEELLAERYRQQEMRTPAHFGIGQEAVAVGVCHSLRPDDAVFSHHRGHNHYLARGGDFYALAAELYGRADGCAGGRGGSVHLTARDKGFIATSAILGETVAAAVGAALSFQMDKSDRIAVTFFGEGTMDEGVFYEALNFAAIKKLPVLFICENNLYATESPMSVRQADGTDLCDRVRAFKVGAERIDGNDVISVHRTAREAVEMLRAGDGPYFIECMTYRWLEHVGPCFDHELNRTYRTREELSDWMDRCPVKRSGECLVQRGLATNAMLEAWLATTREEIGHALDRARAAPWPDVSTLFERI